jgi:hypothetical protein
MALGARNLTSLGMFRARNPIPRVVSGSPDLLSDVEIIVVVVESSPDKLETPLSVIGWADSRGALSCRLIDSTRLHAVDASSRCVARDF